MTSCYDCKIDHAHKSCSGISVYSMLHGRLIDDVIAFSIQTHLGEKTRARRSTLSKLVTGESLVV